MVSSMEPSFKRDSGQLTTIEELRDKAIFMLNATTDYLRAKNALQGHVAFVDVWGIKEKTVVNWLNAGVTPQRKKLSAMIDFINQSIKTIEEGGYCVAGGDDKQKLTLDFFIASSAYEFAEYFHFNWKDMRKLLIAEEAKNKNSSVPIITIPLEEFRNEDNIALRKNLDVLSGGWTAYHVCPTIVDGKVEYRVIRSWIDICSQVSLNTNEHIIWLLWYLPYVNKPLHSIGEQHIPHYRYYGSLAIQKSGTCTWTFTPYSSRYVDSNPDFPYLVTNDIGNNPTCKIGFYTSKSQDNLLYNSTFGLCKSTLMDFDNTPSGRRAYQAARDMITTETCVFNSMEEAFKSTRESSERILLDRLTPHCNVLDMHRGNPVVRVL